MTVSPYRLLCFGLSDPGLSRPNNEDAFMVADVTRKAMGVHANLLAAEFQDQLLGESGMLLAVADGLGGYHGGEVASRLAVEVTVEAMFGMEMLPLPPLEQLGRALETAHHTICQHQLRQRQYEDMASTLTAIHATTTLLTV